MSSGAFREMPAVEQLEVELAREKYKQRYSALLRSTVYTLVIVAAVAILAVTLWLSVLQLYGSSMAPTVQERDIVLSVKTSDFGTGDIVAFYYNNKIVLRRVIGGAGDVIDIDENGTVYLNSAELEEPYLTEKALGACNIELPYEVPEGRLFVLGDSRAEAIDSRNTTFGCVSQEQIIGKVIFRVWPFERIGPVG